MRRPHPKTYFNRIPAPIREQAYAYLQHASRQQVQEDLGRYWQEFVTFWEQQGETPKWSKFVWEYQHRQWFVLYVFKRYPSVAERLQK